MTRSHDASPEGKGKSWQLISLVS